jgi:hypothetical protein
MQIGGHRKRQKILDNQKQTAAGSEGADQADVKYFLPQVVTEFDYWRKKYAVFLTKNYLHPTIFSNCANHRHASVGGSAGGKVRCRRRDGWNGAGTNDHRCIADGSKRDCVFPFLSATSAREAAAERALVVAVWHLRSRQIVLIIKSRQDESLDSISWLGR